KGSTRIGWEGMDQPLTDGNWELVSASAIPWSDGNAVPREITQAEMDDIKGQFVAAAEMAERAGFDMIELHAAHGYLLSSFISPVSNVRTDAYGGSLENRMRWPLEVFGAMRAVWPEEKPMSVRISANDWVGDEGVTPDEAVEIARMFRDAGVDLVDVSAGQTTPTAKPVYGRMFQTPFSDRIRNEGGLPTMAVGNIFEADHANSILMAGRADLVAVGRPHLADPYWTFHEGARIGDRDASDWPKPYQPGRDQLWRLADREAEMEKV
ncbi:MAG: bifunctional salicylyl-CoA 5-hydroxylase/oxidoreductase, partial [Nitratireductor sp.]